MYKICLYNEREREEERARVDTRDNYTVFENKCRVNNVDRVRAILGLQVAYRTDRGRAIDACENATHSARVHRSPTSRIFQAVNIEYLEQFRAINDPSRSAVRRFEID